MPSYRDIEGDREICTAVFLLGAKGVGKTSLLYRFTEELFPAAGLPAQRGLFILVKKMVPSLYIPDEK